jgi:hypothetical protein
LIFFFFFFFAKRKRRKIEKSKAARRADAPLPQKQCAHTSARIAVVGNGTASRAQRRQQKKKSCEKNKMIFFSLATQQQRRRAPRDTTIGVIEQTNQHSMRFVGGVARCRSAHT